MNTKRWRVLVADATAQVCHDFEPNDQDGRVLLLCRPTARSVVLGAAQKADLFDGPILRSQGFELAKRTSGGGAVIVEPKAQLWAHLFIRPDDRLWEDDVLVAFNWIGELSVAFFESLGLKDVSVAKTKGQSLELSRLICFAGVGLSEATWHDKKISGVSQRRRRNYASFQFQLLLSDNQSQLVDLLNMSGTLDPEVDRPLDVSGINDMDQATIFDVEMLETALIETLVGLML
ncbi:MAG: hypothetical protein HKL81_08295 [Acidimicrobiaceae bacterium]|nr:hypothetical protein [Acidimicrobiaceae bacterium]